MSWWRPKVDGRSRSGPATGYPEGMTAMQARRLVVETDRRNYSAVGFTPVGEGSYRRARTDGLWDMVNDGLEERAAPQRSAVIVGVQDEELERISSGANAERFSKGVASLSQFLPLPGEPEMEGQRLTGVLLFHRDGGVAERWRVARVTGIATKWRPELTDPVAVRRAVVSEAIAKERRSPSDLVRMGVAALLLGDVASVDRAIEELSTWDLPEVVERLQEMRGRA